MATIIAPGRSLLPFVADRLIHFLTTFFLLAAVSQGNFCYVKDNYKEQESFDTKF